MHVLALVFFLGLYAPFAVYDLVRRNSAAELERMPS
jgi:hypothetical protein